MWTSLPNWEDLEDDGEQTLDGCFRELWPRLRDRAMRLYGLTESHAEDAAQETCLALTRESRQASHKSPLPFWLARVFYFKVMDQKRGPVRKPAESLDRIVEETGETLVAPDTPSWSQADMESTCGWLQNDFHLTELESILIVEHAIEGRTSEQLVERYGHLLHAPCEPEADSHEKKRALKRQANHIRVLICRTLKKIRERWRD